MSIFENINRIREAKGLSVRKVEIGAGIGIGSISKWEKSLPGIDKLTKVADFLGVSLADLLAGTDYEIQDIPQSMEESDIRAAFYGGDAKDLTEEDKEALWQDVREYYAFKLEQKRKEKRKK